MEARAKHSPERKIQKFHPEVDQFLLLFLQIFEIFLQQLPLKVFFQNQYQALARQLS